MIGPERREFYPEFKETDLEILRPFIPQSDFLENFPSLEEEFETYQLDLSHLLNQPETCQQIAEIRQTQNQFAEAKSKWKKEEGKLRNDVSVKKQKQDELIDKIKKKERDLLDRERDENEGRVGVAFGKAFVAAAQRWPSTKGILASLGLITTLPDFKKPLHRHLRPLFEEVIALDKPLKELERKNAHQKYEQTIEAFRIKCEKLEKPLLEKFSDWGVEDRDRVIIFTLNDQKHIEKWTSAYLERAVKNPAQEEVLNYFSWVLQTYGTLGKEVDRSLFSKWSSLCFKEKSPQEITELLQPGKSLDFEEEVAYSLGHFSQNLKHPRLREDFSQFLRWWLNSELKFYGLPIREKELSPYFISLKRKLEEKPRKEEVLKPPEIAEEPFFVLIAGQEKPLTGKELAEYLMEVLGDHVGPENIPLLSSSIENAVRYIREQSFAPHLRFIKGQKTRLELGAMRRIRWRRWRVLANIVSYDHHPVLQLVGALHRDWGYEGGRVIFFS